MAEPKVEIKTPKNGAKFNVGDKISISWVSSNIPANSKLGISILYNQPKPNDCSSAGFCGMPGPTSFLVINERIKLPASATSFVWAVTEESHAITKGGGKGYWINLWYSDQKESAIASARVDFEIGKKKAGV